jgi:hypothetical protein
MKINSIIRHVALLGIVAVAATSAMADEIKLNLTGSQEVPPVATMAAGSAVFTINKDMTVSGSVTTTGIVATMAHIHVGKLGVNGPVAIGLIKSGDNGWTVPPAAKLTEAQYQAYQGGDLYVNVHSAEHKGGEIRAQLPPPAAAMSRQPGY